MGLAFFTLELRPDMIYYSNDREVIRFEYDDPKGLATIIDKLTFDTARLLVFWDTTMNSLRTPVQAASQTCFTTEVKM